MRHSNTDNSAIAAGKCRTTSAKRAGVISLVAALLAISAQADQHSASGSGTPDTQNKEAAPKPSGAVTRDTSILGGSEAASMAQFSLVDQASAVLRPAPGSAVRGEIIFTPDEAREQMRIHVRLQGMKSGKHGFHIHAVGDCSAEDFSSAGGHFNPYNTQHGGPHDARHHLGDLGNIIADASGNVDVTLTSPRLGFSGPNSVLQKAVIVHSRADDLTTDPTGNAGPRIACGVITQDHDIVSESLEKAGNEDEVEPIMPTVQ